MEFDDFFEDKRKRHGNYREHGYHDDNRYSHDSYPSIYGQIDHQKWISILDKIRSNKKLKLFVVIAAIVILVMTIALVIALLPLILKLFNFIGQNGVQGLLDSVAGFLDKLWKGSGK